MKYPVQIRFSGAGGQGLITAGVILAEAAMLDGLNVVQTQTYGPEARLGSSRAEVIISDGTIAYPEVGSPDVVLCMSVEAARKYATKVRPDTVVILDATFIGPEIGGVGRVIRLPITDAAETLGSKVVANTVALSVLNTIVQVVSKESLTAAILARVPSKYRELNRQAGEVGVRLASDAVAASM